MLRQSRFGLTFALVLGLVLTPAFAVQAAEISDFVGSYSGQAEDTVGDETKERDMSVEIAETRKGFRVDWTTISYRSDGRVKVADYSIDFVPSDRENVFAAASRTNMFGHEVQNDPMKGDPYVWARIVNDTMTVFSLFVDDDGGYEIQEFNRTLAKGGLELDFLSVRNGAKRREISTFLEKE